MFHKENISVLSTASPMPNSRLSKKTVAVVGLLILFLLIPMARPLQTRQVLFDTMNGDNDNDNDDGRKTGDLMLLVEPAVVNVKAGQKAEYSVFVTNIKSNHGMVYITVDGLPKNSIGIFTPNMGMPSFVSKLTIVTENVNPGSYELTINAMNRKQMQRASAALTISGTATTSIETTTTTSTSTEQNLKITFSTDKLSYDKGEPVNIEGVVTDSSQNSILGAAVSIQVQNYQGSTAHIYQTLTDIQGFFNDTFTLPGDTMDGTYTTSISAAHQGHTGVAHSTFAVGNSATPAVSIVNMTITANGIQATTVKQGQEVLISVDVLNQGADLEKGMVWIEIDDPNDVPVFITMLSTGLSHGQVVGVEFHFFLANNAIFGLYGANTYVSNGYISEGGVFFDKEQRTLIVETAESTVTTTTSQTITTNQTTTTNETTHTATTATNETTQTTTNTTETSTTTTSTTSETTNQTTTSTTNTATNSTSTETSNQTSFTETDANGQLLQAIDLTIEKLELVWRLN